MKTEETIEKDQNRQMPGVNEKKKKLKTGILLLFAVVILLAITGGLAFQVYVRSVRQSKFEGTGTRWRDFCPARARRIYKRN